MRALSLTLTIVFGATTMIFSSNSFASEEYKIQRPNSGEVFVYHSCGCADSCWVAEIRDRKTRAVKSRLRCDCEKLFYSQPKRVNEYIVDNCGAINDSKDKLQSIENEMKKLQKTKTVENSK